MISSNVCSVLGLCTGIVIVVCLTPGVSVAKNVKNQLEHISDDVHKIIDYILTGPGRHQTYSRLAELSDKFGSRLLGSQSLENALDFIIESMKADGFQNVHEEEVKVPHWVRGKEWARMEQPRTVDLSMLGLGYSTGTLNMVNQTVTADAIVFESFDEMERHSNKIAGNMVVFNQPWTGYLDSAQYRKTAALRVAPYGAVAVLVRSVTSLSIYSPHTGRQDYNPEVRMIPAACITVEDAEMLRRIQDRGERIVISLYMEATRFPDTTSRNVVGEIIGYEHPRQSVIFGGHIDSWDVGTGSVDDGGGVMMAWQALAVLIKLGLKPRRTIRVVLWTGEEFGNIGAEAYFNAHQDEIKNVSLIMESDTGAMKPIGITFTGSRVAALILKRIMSELGEIHTTSVEIGGGQSADTLQWVDAGVPGASLLTTAQTEYMYYHHSNGDRMTVMDPDDLDRCTIIWATVAYSVACLDDLLPRNRTV